MPWSSAASAGSIDFGDGCGVAVASAVASRVAVAVAPVRPWSATVRSAAVVGDAVVAGNAVGVSDLAAIAGTTMADGSGAEGGVCVAAGATLGAPHPALATARTLTIKADGHRRPRKKPSTMCTPDATMWLTVPFHQIARDLGQNHPQMTQFSLMMYCFRKRYPRKLCHLWII